jgi:Fic-DOC domain mobile mystery protein B
VGGALTDALTPSDTTPLDRDEAEGLIPSWVATRADLNAAEASGIATGRAWALGLHLAPEAICESAFLLELHRRLFASVWTWAGKYRRFDKNIGVDWHYVGAFVEEVLADCGAWMADTSPKRMSDDEIAVRLHHRLVVVHSFPNGNDRHARTVADLLAGSLDLPMFSWGGRGNLANPGGARSAYIAALVAADNGNLAPLVDFARS